MRGEKLRESFTVLVTILSLSCTHVQCASRTPELSARPPLGKPVFLNSYLPPAMQVLAHFTNQMKFERPETTSAAPTTTTSTTTVSWTSSFQPQKDDESSTTSRQDLTTPPHAPGNYAPSIPPRPRTSNDQSQDFGPTLPLLPFSGRSYNVPNTDFLPEILPHNDNLPAQLFTKNRFALENPNIPLSGYPLETYPIESPIELYEPNPFHVPGIQYPQGASWYSYGGGNGGKENPAVDEIIPDISTLPVANENNFKFNPLELDADELIDENLQYLTPTVREMLQGLHETKQLNTNGHPLASYQSIEDLFDNNSDKQEVSDWLRLRKAPPNQTLIQMLLMYDLLSRDAKKQKLNNYNGYTPEILKDLVETSQGTAIDQLRTVLERMVARGDCTHEFANNRAKEMIAELGKPDSKMSKELRYLEPLKYME